ncbi:MAG TPA: LysE family transporter [Chloroflexota bacterium]|nr:LysE family transporter [Chloroflexota bacterium]
MVHSGPFYTTFLPQFIGPSQPVFATSMFLGGIHAFMGLLWLSGYASVVAQAGDVLRRPAVKQLLDRITSVVLIAFGARLAMEQR